MIWKDNRIQTNRANLVLPDNKVGSSKIARDRNVNANSVSAKNKVANRVVVAANRAVVAANRVVSRADDKPGYLEKESGGRQLPPFFLSVHRYNHALPLLRGPLAILDKQPG